MIYGHSFKAFFLFREIYVFEKAERYYRHENIHSMLNHFFKVNRFAARAALSLGIVEGPNPCRANNSFSENAETCSGVVILLASSARLAGAERRDKNPSFDLRCASQTGQVKQSLLL